ncbi:MAG: hypothetical protein GEU92_12150 [Alphaproteobacteria bacterium]|nr:hypothetical protein [Alphaproteobacteria bacterium]
MFQPGRDDDIRMFFTANFPAGFMDASISGPSIVPDAAGENYGESGDGYKGGGIGSAARDEMNDRLRALAAAIKASGVIIYTTQFANSGGLLQALMREVATGPDSPYYHYAPDGEALRAVFREVANNLSELRLSK